MGRNSRLDSNYSENNTNKVFETNRSCTDLLCTVFFICFGVATVALAVFCYYRDADPRRLVSGYDKFGNTCGRKNEKISDAPYSGFDTTNYKYHYTEKGFNLCVHACPNIDFNSINDLINLYDNFNIKMCKYDIKSEDYAFDDGKFCAKQGSSATSPFILDCIPKNGLEVMGKEYSSKLISDIYVLKTVILICSLSTIPLSFIWLIVLKYSIGFCIHSILLTGVLGSLAGTSYMWLAYNGKYIIEKSAIDYANLWLSGSIIVSIASFIVVLIYLVMLKRVKIAVAIFQEAGKAMGSMPALAMQPMFAIIYFLFSAILLGILLISLITPTKPEINSDGTEVTFSKDNFMYFWILIAFLIIWIYQIAHDSTEFIIAGSISRWYFTRNKRNLRWPIVSTINDLILYHFGSIAFGSFIIALIKFIRMVMMYITRKLDEVKADCLRQILYCINCCLACFEKTLKFLTRNAYIEISISGRSFLPSAKRSFKFMISHAISLATINAVTFLVLWLSRIIIAIGIGIGAYYWQKEKFDQNTYNYIYTAAVISGILAFIIAHIFMEVYDVSKKFSSNLRE